MLAISKRPVNLRMASLDPNTPRSKKDCKTCSRRRIRCDRSLPTCQKCKIRDLDCPGYDAKLKWDQGIASRGRFAGRPAPVETVNDCIRDSPTSKGRTGTSVAVTKVQDELNVSETGGETLAIDGVVNSAAFKSPKQYFVPRSLSVELHGQDQFRRRLVQHYDQNLASTFVWVDSFDNPWRKVILPLAFEEPSLLYSLLALAAEHLNRRSPTGGSQSHDFQTAAAQYRQKSLQLLAQRLSQETTCQTERWGLVKSHNSSAKSILATMLLLCQLEMVQSESMAWKTHLRGSHTIIQRCLLDSSGFNMSDADSKFLIKETFTINVFAETSNFSDEETLNFPVDQADDHTLFDSLMTMIHEITRKERRQHCDQLDFSIELPRLMQELEQARNSTQLHATRYEKLQQEATRAEFQRVIDIYHHAAIIYAHQALAIPGSAQDLIKLHLGKLLELLHSLPATGSFAQDLAWPLFIASTECRDRKHEQQILQQMMEESANAIGFANCSQAWKFLKKWWDEEEDSKLYPTWIGFARARAFRGHNFFVF